MALWRDQLKRRFSPSRYLRRSDGLQLLSAGGAGSEWLVARALCAYTVLDGAAVPTGKRRAFVEMAVRRWAPFADPASHVQWAGDQAMVWAWSQTQVQEFDDDAPIEAPRRMLPESLLLGAPQEHGAQLIALDQGYEGRVWRAHVLSGSQWWPQLPELAQWNVFLRGAGLAPAQALPAVPRFERHGEAWNALQGASLGDLWGRHHGLLTRALAALVAAALLVPAAGIARLALAQSAVAREIAAQDDSLQAILNAREQAERDAQTVDALLALRPPQSQIDLLLRASALVPGNAWTLLEWRMPNPDLLEMQVRMQMPDPRALVEAWEGSKQFSGVTAELGRSPDEVLIRARILRDSLPREGVAP